MCGRSRQIWTRDCLGRLQDLREAQGKPDLFEAFARLLVKQHKLKLPNGHGYGGSFATRDKAAVWKDLAGIMARLEGLGLKVILN